MENLDNLIYDLIFSETVDYSIEIMNYMDRKDVYKYDKFIKNIKSILKKSKVSVIKEKLNIESNSITWEIKVKK